MNNKVSQETSDLIRDIVENIHIAGYGKLSPEKTKDMLVKNLEAAIMFAKKDEFANAANRLKMAEAFANALKTKV
jgi:hypothetical protein